MKSRNFILAITVAVVTAMTIPTYVTAQKQVRYTVTDLGTLGGTFSKAFGINNKGSVVGFATVPGDTALHAFVWRNGLMTDLGTLGGPLSAGYSINDDDEVAGLSETSTPDPLNICGDSLICLPVLWQNGGIAALPTLGGPDGEASAINSGGQVVGVAMTDEIDPMCGTPVLKPAVWEKGEVRALPTAPFRDGIVGGAPGPAGNNDKGQVVGIATACNGSSSRTLLWEKHRVIDMGTMAGLTLVPTALNDKDQAVGVYTTTAGVNRAFLWQNDVATDLGTLPGDVSASGNAINDKGQIAGQTCSPLACTVFLWRDGVMTDLNAVVPADSSLHMFDPAGINARGEVVGLAIQKATGEGHAFLAVPCDDEHANEKGCEDRGFSVAHTQARPNVEIRLPENVRRVLRGGVGSQFHLPIAF